MPQPTSTHQLDDYFRHTDDDLSLDKEPIAEICEALSEAKANLETEKVVFALIQKLEVEKDEVKADLYRKAIELAIKGEKKF